MKNLKKFLIIIFILIIYIYVCNISMLPNNIILMQGEALNLNTFLGINIKNSNVVTASSNLNNSIVEETGKMELKLNLFNLFSVKDVTVNVIPKTTVVPLGKAIGMKMYTKGVLVVGMSEIEGEKPYENSGIEAGDTIVEINNTKINSTDDLIECVNNSKGTTVEVKYISDEQEKVVSMEPAKTSNNEYKLGLWVRDAAAGVGTITFYEPSTQSFGALGHGITDIDTGDLLNIASGEFVTAKVLNIKKGEDGNPGKIQGTVEEQEMIGEITKNTEFGIYGKIQDLSSLNIDTSKEMEVAMREEIETGKATILCSLDNQTVKEYEIEITKIYRDNNYNNKSMEIKVTDDELIEKTGGIIQGMSGSPIIQNGKFVGAVTHVLVNSSTEGYAIFGDLMLKQSKEVN